MAVRIREPDWSATTLEPLESWPRSFKTSVDMVLAHGFPMMVPWGSERLGLYNEACRPLLGDRHPTLPGRPLYTVRPEMRDTSEPRILPAWAGETVVHCTISLPVSASTVAREADRG